MDDKPSSSLNYPADYAGERRDTMTYLTSQLSARPKTRKAEKGTP